MESWGIPGSIIRRPNMVAPGEEQRIVQTCQRKMERRILKVVLSDRVTNAEVRQRTKKKDTVAVAHCLKCKWGGHAVRMD